jgi:hypothetical protein
MEARELGSRTEILQFLADRDGPDCYLCEKPFTLTNRETIDHYHPLSKGGTWELTNLRLAHKRCNTEKGDRLFVDGVLEERPKRESYRDRKVNKVNIIERFCELCYDGRLLKPEEICPECDREAVEWPWSTKLEPSRCPHAGIWWCWACTIGVYERTPAIVQVLDGEILD